MAAYGFLISRRTFILPKDSLFNVTEIMILTTGELHLGVNLALKRLELSKN